MRKALRAVVLVVIVAAAGSTAAAPNDFYLNLLRRGIAFVQAGNYEAGLRSLRIAAFGLVDYIPQFQTAQIHIALAADRLGREADARHALQRVLAAERIERAYGTLALTPAVRAEVDRIAGRLLTTDQRAVLYGGPEQPEAAPQVAATSRVPMPPPPAPMTPAVVPQPTPVPLPQPTPVPVAPPTPVPVPQPKPPVPVPQPQPALPVPQPQPAPPPSVRGVAPQASAAQPEPTTPARVPAPHREPSGHRATVSALEGAKNLKPQERYQLAVALYEIGRYADAKRELAAALPHIEITPDVARYRAKIEGAIVP